MAWAISKPRDAWLRQAREAWAALEPQAPHGSALRDLSAIDQHTFALLIEALAALTPGQVSQELPGPRRPAPRGRGPGHA